MQIRYSFIPPGKRKNNRFFLVRGRTPDGREFEVSTRCTDETHARRAAAIIYARLCEERPATIQPVAWSFSDACDAYIRWRTPAPADLDRIERLRTKLGSLPVAQVGQEDLVNVARAHPRQVAGATLNREYVRPFAAVLHYAREAGARGDIRVRAFPERAPDVRVAQRAHVDLLIANAANEDQKLLLQWCWDLGSRISDTLRVMWDEVDLQNSQVRLTVGKKAGQVVVLPLPRSLIARLANVPVKRGRVFPWSTKSGVYKWLGPLCKSVGVQFRPHDARRALATEQFDAGADPRMVQELLGHASLKSTLRYRHVGLKQMAAQQRRRSG